jgi:hypothetical protein
VIGRINLPLVNEGEALFYIARLEPGAEPGAEALTTLLPDLDEACPGDSGGAAAGLAPSS